MPTFNKELFLRSVFKNFILFFKEGRFIKQELNCYWRFRNWKVWTFFSPIIKFKANQHVCLFINSEKYSLCLQKNILNENITNKNVSVGLVDWARVAENRPNPSFQMPACKHSIPFLTRFLRRKMSCPPPIFLDHIRLTPDPFVIYKIRLERCIILFKQKITTVI